MICHSGHNDLICVLYEASEHLRKHSMHVREDMNISLKISNIFPLNNADLSGSNITSFSQNLEIR